MHGHLLRRRVYARHIANLGAQYMLGQPHEALANFRKVLPAPFRLFFETTINNMVKFPRAIGYNVA